MPRNEQKAQTATCSQLVLVVSRPRPPHQGEEKEAKGPNLQTLSFQQTCSWKIDWEDPAAGHTGHFSKRDFLENSFKKDQVYT